MRKAPLHTKPMDPSDDFEQVYKATSKRIFGFMFWRTRDSELSEDLTSTVYEKAWRSRSRFHGGSMQAWLYTIARNVLTDYWRSKRSVPLENVEAMADEQTDISEKIDADMRSLRLRQALQKLPPDMRAVVELRFIEGFSGKQVAEKLKLSNSNVRVIQYRALKKMRDLIDEQ